MIAPSTAVATVTIAATPSLPMKLTRETESPASAIATVQPETITARPLVDTDLPAASTGSTPSISSWR